MQSESKTNAGSRGYLFSIVMVAVLGGLLFGYDTAVISGAEKGLQAFFLGANDFQYHSWLHVVVGPHRLHHRQCLVGALRLAPGPQEVAGVCRRVLFRVGLGLNVP